MIANKKKGKGSFYIAQYPVRWTAQSALHFLILKHNATGRAPENLFTVLKRGLVNLRILQ